MLPGSESITLGAHVIKERKVHHSSRSMRWRRAKWLATQHLGATCEHLLQCVCCCSVLLQCVIVLFQCVIAVCRCSIVHCYVIYSCVGQCCCAHTRQKPWQMAARTHESVTNSRVQAVRRHVHLARATEARYRGSQQTRDLTYDRRGGEGERGEGGFQTCTGSWHVFASRSVY